TMNSITRTLTLAGLVLAASGLGAFAQNYDLSWNTIDGGGATFSTSGTYSLGGTIGQPDAGPMSGGQFTLTGGFWPAAAPGCTLPGDINLDGHVDGDDVQPFVNCLIGGGGSCGCADLNGGGLDSSDVPVFVAALLNG